MASLKLPPAPRLSTPDPTKYKSCKPPVSIAAFLKQDQQQKRETKKIGRGDGSSKKPRPSPLLTAEEIAARFGLDVAVADLERLFRRAACVPPVGPASPSGERRPLRVAYQGGRGSYCQEAAAESFRDLSFESFPCLNMEEAFSALEDRSADRAVIPAENSVDGPIDRNLDLLLRHRDVNIVGELVLPVNHCLLSLPSTRLSELRRVVSHPQALSHCKQRLECLNVEVDEVDSAADAAKFVAENGISDTAVIGSNMAAEEFGLQVLENNFQDPTDNYNRFLQLGLGLGLDSGTGPGPRTTTLAFSLNKGVSDLFRAMWVFETLGVKVKRVEHRPNRANPIRVAEKETGKAVYLDYVFVLDLEGSGSDPKVRRAITGLDEIAGFVRVLGSYTTKCGRTGT
nr:Arogenate dehydratase/prephenate dehydratase 1 [Crinum x powellii]